MRQEIIEYVILGGAPTAQDVADHLGCGYSDAVVQLEQLRDEGLVRNLSKEGPEDFDWVCDSGCLQHYGGRYLHRRAVHWTYCGGPVSQALSVAEKIKEDITNGRAQQTLTMGR